MSAIHESPAWKKLVEHAATNMSKCHLRNLLNDADRCSHLVAAHDGIVMDYSRQLVVPETMDLLFELAEAANLPQKMQRMSSGAKINSTENRSVLHFALRAAENANISSDGANVVPGVHSVLQQIAAFSTKVRAGEWLGCTGRPITNIVSVGIGGSYLGPEFVFEALRNDATASAAAENRTLRFLANVDPVDVSRALAGLDPETTLVCVVSKTFTTAETMMNARTVVHWLLDCMLGITKLGFSEKATPITRETIVRQHVVAISTAVKKATDFGIAPENIFPFWDWVGGRYSVCSAVGMLPLSLHYGYDVMAEFLRGARGMDQHFFEAPLRSNLPVLLGLLGVWNTSFLKHNTRAVLPYSQALLRFPAHIQQLEMESNGKRVSASTGATLPYPTGEVIFGEPGTNGQHSFYQLIHQGSNVVPCEFIGFLNSQTPMHYTDTETVPNHDELMSNFFAQPDALACGKTVAELVAEGVPRELHSHKEFPGNRPSLSLLLPHLTAYSTGQLLSLYEHRTAVQGFVWDVNSFDQWGVELGKVLAVKVRNTLIEANHQTQQIGAGADEAAASGAAAAAVNLSGYNPSTRALLQLYIQNKAKAKA